MDDTGTCEARGPCCNYGTPIVNEMAARSGVGLRVEESAKVEGSHSFAAENMKPTHACIHGCEIIIVYMLGSNMSTQLFQSSDSTIVCITQHGLAALSGLLHAR